MPTRPKPTEIEFGGPANYRIVVQGALSPDWGERLAGLTITTGCCSGSEKPRTTLVGPVRDQAELSGVLDTLYGLHLPILKVEKVEDPEEPSGGDS